MKCAIALGFAAGMAAFAAAMAVLSYVQQRKRRREIQKWIAEQKKRHAETACRAYKTDIGGNENGAG